MYFVETAACQQVNPFYQNYFQQLPVVVNPGIHTAEQQVTSIVSRLAMSVFTKRVVLKNLHRFSYMLDLCNRFDYRSQRILRKQLFFLQEVMEQSGVQENFMQSDKILNRVQFLLNSSSNVSEILIELALIIYFSDNTTRAQEFLYLEHQQAVSDFYFARKFSVLREQSLPIKNILREFSEIVFTTSNGYNSGGLHAVKHLLFGLSSFLNELHLNHMMIVLDHMIQESEKSFDQIFSSTVNVDSQMKKFIAEDLDIANEELISSVHVFRACFIVLLASIKQVYTEPNCYAIASLIFAIQNRPECVVRCIVNFLQSGECKFGAVTIALPKISNYLLNWLALGNRNCEFSPRGSSSERSQLLQLTLGLVECRNHNCELGVKEKLITFICDWLLQYFKIKSENVNLEGDAQLLVDRIGKTLSERIIFFPRYDKETNLFEDIGKTKNRELLTRASLGMIYKFDDEGETDYYYLNSFELFSQIIFNLLVSFNLQYNSPVFEKIVISFSLEEVRSLADGLAVYISQELNLGLDSEYVKRCDLVTFVNCGGFTKAAGSFFGIPFKNSGVPEGRARLDNFLSQIFGCLDFFYKEKMASVLVGSSTHSWVLTKNNFFSKFSNATELQNYIRSIVLSAGDKVKERMKLNVPDQIKKNLISQIARCKLTAPEFNTYGDFASFIKPVLIGLASKSKAYKISSIINIEFNKLVISLDELREVLGFMRIDFSEQDVCEIHGMLPKKYRQSISIANILRDILIKKGVILSRYEIELSICFLCANGTLSVPIYLGDLNYGSDVHSKNDLIAEMNALSESMQLYVRAGDGSFVSETPFWKENSPFYLTELMVD